MQNLKDLLLRQNASLVAYASGDIHMCFGKGVSDLYRLYTTMPSVLLDALVADKVVGKGAAALMILAGVRRVHAIVISTPALALFADSCVEVTYDKAVDNIINRKADGICPVEKLCIHATTPQECLPLIKSFLQSLRC